MATGVSIFRSCLTCDSHPRRPSQAECSRRCRRRTPRRRRPSPLHHRVRRIRNFLQILVGKDHGTTRERDQILRHRVDSFFPLRGSDPSSPPRAGCAPNPTRASLTAAERSFLIKDLATRIDRRREPPRDQHGLGQSRDQLGNGLAATGVERHLLADVAPGRRAAQVTHQVDDAVELVGFEREDPLVVPERE